MTLSTASEVERFVTDYAEHMRSGNAAIFAGAGLSVASGAVDWKGLLRDITNALGLSVDEEHDLVAVAQFHVNKSGSHRSELSRAILDNLAVGLVPNDNHRILALLPITTFWTTNYDSLIETALRDAGKIVDVKSRVAQLALTMPRRDAVVYKMHGDAAQPDDTVLTKDDFEKYYLRRGPFTTALAGDLVEKTFLFIGLSFADPQLDYVLARIRSHFEQNERRHYCVMRERKQLDGESSERYKRALVRQELMIEDLRRFNIHTLVVPEYAAITDLLQRILDVYRRRTVFISGSAADFTPWTSESVGAFLRTLGKVLVEKKFRVVSGMGLGVGDNIISGAVGEVYSHSRQYVEDWVISRPFPQQIDADSDRHAVWKRYRHELIRPAGISLFLFGNKIADGNVVSADGVRREFDIARELGSIRVPVGSTGWMAGELWREVERDMSAYFPDLSETVERLFRRLGEQVGQPIQLVEPIVDLVTELARG